MKSYIHFIRHGITEGNIRRWYYGWTDVPLLPEGVQELTALRDQGIYPPLLEANCYTSGMLRTEQTLEVIYGDVPHKALPLMKEMNFGQWEMRTFEDLKAEPLFNTWMNDKTGNFSFPDGDSPASFSARVSHGLTELRGLHRLKELSHRHNGRDAVSILVCHGGVIGNVMEQMFPGQRDNFWQWIPDPGHGYTVYFDFATGQPINYEAF